jgi:hypothetical protein
MSGRFKVYFAVWGDWPEPSGVTSVIGREPDEFIAKGAAIGDAGLVRKQSIWRIFSSASDVESIEQHLESLLAILEPHGEGIRRIVGKARAGISCAAYWETSQTGFHLSRSLVARTSALGLSLDFDMCCSGDQP